MGKTIFEEAKIVKTLNEAKYSHIHRLTILAGAFGALTDIFIIQALGASTFSIVPHFLLSTSNFSYTASFILIGGFIGALLVGRIVDVIGRRNVFLGTLAAIIVLSVVSAFAQTATELDIIRLLMGFADGANYPAVLSLVAEFLPTKRRGRGISYIWVGFALGGVLSYLAGFFLYVTIGPTTFEWRILLGMGAIPATIALALQISLPESPRWAISKGKYEMASNSIKRLTGTELAMSELENSRQALFIDQAPVLKRHRRTYILLAIPLVVAIFGFNLIPGALATLNPTILSSLNVQKADTLLFSASFWVFQLIASLIVASTIETGRLRLVLVGGILESVSAILVVFIYHSPIVLFIAFSGIFFFGFLAIPVLRNTGSELFPTEFRGLSNGIIMGTDRFAVVAGLLMTPILFVGNDVIRLFLVYGIFGIIGSIAAFIGLHRLKIDKRSLEQIQSELTGGE